MDTLRLAIASNDGVGLNKEHFGDSHYYYIYEVNENDYKFIKRISNQAKNIIEEKHADPLKAGGVTKVLQEHNIQLVGSGVFGPNIKRINKKFVCILFGKGQLEDNLSKVVLNFAEIKKKWLEGEDRQHLCLD